MVNRVILVGNLGKDPEVKTLESGAKVAKFSVATNENYKDKNGEWQQNTEWHEIVAWRSLAEKAEGLEKGKVIYLEGKLSTRSWQDQNGNNRKTTEVVASYFRTIRKGQAQNYNNAPAAAPASMGNMNTANEEADDDLPF